MQIGASTHYSITVTAKLVQNFMVTLYEPSPCIVPVYMTIDMKNALVGKSDFSKIL